MCQALITASKVQDKSPSLLTTMTASLEASFSPSEVISASARAVCSVALLRITSLTRKGYLQGSKSASQAVANLISLYTVTSTSTSTGASASSSTMGNHLGAGEATTIYPVSTAVSTTRFNAVIETYIYSTFRVTRDFVTDCDVRTCDVCSTRK